METVIDASNEVDLEVNTEKTKYMLLSRHQTAGQNHDIKIVHRCFENVAQFRYLGRDVVQAVSRWLPTAAARVQTRV
jgi:hypothetical protein